MAVKVGIQLYSVKNALQERPYETLRQVAEAGYRYVEAANHDAENDPGVGFGMPAHQLKEILDELGLQMVGCHVNPLRTCSPGCWTTTPSWAAPRSAATSSSTPTGTWTM